LLAELRLSEQLREELDQMKAALVGTEARARTAEQAKISLSSEVQHLRLLTIKSASDLKLMGTAHFQTLRNAQLHDLQMTQLRADFTEMQELYTGAERKMKEMAVQLHDQRAKNDIRCVKFSVFP
jgi:hypothetical protein